MPETPNINIMVTEFLMLAKEQTDSLEQQATRLQERYDDLPEYAVMLYSHMVTHMRLLERTAIKQAEELADIYDRMNSLISKIVPSE